MILELTTPIIWLAFDTQIKTFGLTVTSQKVYSDLKIKHHTSYESQRSNRLSDVINVLHKVSFLSKKITIAKIFSSSKIFIQMSY